MKNKIIIALIAICFCTSLFNQTHSQTKQKFEYKFAFNPSEKDVNKLASDGWEFVAASTTGSGPASNVSTFIFRREK